jgi:regulator of replication initiation timing
MFDAALVPAALGSLKIILDLVKNVKDAKLSARVVSEVIDLQSKLVGMGQQAVELQEENRRLMEENAALKKERTWAIRWCSTTARIGERGTTEQRKAHFARTAGAMAAFTGPR